MPGVGCVRKRAAWFCFTPVTPPVSTGSGWCAAGGATSALALPNGGHRAARLSRKEGVAGEPGVSELDHLESSMQQSLVLPLGTPLKGC